ncbi:MAG TPA: hypothetical protein VGK19_22810 [Capsulimonadaceae bacterium]
MERKKEGLSHYIFGGIIMIALIFGGVYLYRHMTQVELTLVNATGAPLRDVQVVKHPRRFFLGDVEHQDQRVVSFPVRNDSGYVLTFVTNNKQRKYYDCPEYLYSGLHVRWTVMKDGSVVGETAMIPGNWKGDPRAFVPAKGIKKSANQAQHRNKRVARAT